METIPPMISIRWKEKLPACISKDGKVPARIPPTVTLIFQRVLKEKKIPAINGGIFLLIFFIKKWRETRHFWREKKHWVVEN